MVHRYSSNALHFGAVCKAYPAGGEGQRREWRSGLAGFLPFGGQCSWPGNGSPRECQTQSTGPCSQTLQTRSKKYYRETRGCELVLTLQLHLPTKVSREDLGMNWCVTILSISTGKEINHLRRGTVSCQMQFLFHTHETQFKGEDSIVVTLFNAFHLST